MGNKKTKTNKNYIKKSKSKSKNKLKKDNKSNKKNVYQQDGGRLISNGDFRSRFFENIKLIKNPDEILDVPIKRPPRPDCTIL